MLQAGAIAFSDGSRSIANARILRRAMVYARDFDALVIHFAEDHDLAADGVMNEGAFASRLGLLGIPQEAETIILERDMRLVALTRGSRYHAACVTTAASLAIIAKAKAAGLPVTCATSINHLTLNENDIGDYRTFLKLKPPLRREDDRLALVEAVASGLIDAIMSDHDPQGRRGETAPLHRGGAGCDRPRDHAACGAPPRRRRPHEPARAATCDERAARRRSCACLRARLEAGAPADLDPLRPRRAPSSSTPRSSPRAARTTPFDQARMEGRVKLTLVAGDVVFEA